jgi:hypothetical protein
VIEENYIKTHMLIEEESKSIIVKSAKGIETITPFSHHKDSINDMDSTPMLISIPSFRFNEGLGVN